MEPWVFASMAATGIGLALAVALVYVLLRFSAWTPGGGSPVASARMHGMVTALIALFATGTAGLASLFERGQGQVSPSSMGVDHDAMPHSAVTELPPLSLGPLEALWTVTGPAFWLLVIYWVAQYTWPRPAGQVRTARLAPREAGHYLPRGLTWTVVAIVLAAAAAVALAWTTPSSPAIHIQQVDGSQEYGYSHSEWTQTGFRSGAEFAPWLLIGLAVLVLATALTVLVIARRPPLSGLSMADDDATRRIATNRTLRTAAVVATGFLVHSAQAWARGVQEEALRLARPHPSNWLDDGVDLHSEGWMASVPDPVRWIDTAAPVVGFVLLLLMFAWRSPAVAELGSGWTDEEAAAGGTQALTARGRPGTPEAVRRLRRDGRWLALLIGGAVAFTAMMPLGLAVQGLSESEPWLRMVWAAAPFAVALLLMLLTELGVRRGHAPRASTEHPVLTGTAPRWRWVVLGLAATAATLIALLSLVSPLHQPALAVPILAITVTMGALTVLAARTALHRPALGRSSTVWDEFLRTAGADRLLGVGTSGIFAATAAVVPAAAPLWDALFAQRLVPYESWVLSDTVRDMALVISSALILAAALSAFWPSPTPPRGSAPDTGPGPAPSLDDGAEAAPLQHPQGMRS